MSNVTNIVLLFDAPDTAPLLAEVNAYFAHTGNTKMLVEVQDYAGGNKAMQSAVAIGAANYLDALAFIEHCRVVVQWQEHGAYFAQLALEGEHNTGFGIVDIYRPVNADKQWSVEYETTSPPA